MRRRRILWSTVTLLAALAVGPSTQAQAHFDSSLYSHAGSGCANHVDPITLVFLGFNAYATAQGHSSRTVDLLNGMRDIQHVWRTVGGGDQYASSHGYCTKMETDSASSNGAPRYHLRLNQTHHKDLNGRFETVGTPHYEIDAPNGCGHVVPPDSYTSGQGSGFVLGRGHVKNDWLSAYGSGKLYKTENWGNSEPQRQCNDWYAANADGIVYWLNTD